MLAACGHGYESEDVAIASPHKDYGAFHLLRDARKLAKTLKHEAIDTIICNVEPLLPCAAILKKKMGVRKLLLIGEGTYAYYPFVSGLKSHWMGFFTSAIDDIIAPSEYTRKKIEEWYGGHVHIVKWGVDLSRYRPGMRETKHDQFVFIGQLKERKGVRYLIQAFKALLRTHPGCRLVFIGDYNPSHKQLITSEGIENHVMFTGVIDHQQMVEILGSSKCHVLPSVNAETQFEGYGLVHLEANACGIPSIGCRGTANEEVIIDGYNGFLVNQKDPDELHGRMETILSDPEWYSRMCANALKHAAAHPWEASIDQIIRIAQ